MTTYGDKVKSTSINGVKLYHVSCAPNVATWLNPKKQRALRKNPHYMQRVELIQDFKFGNATTRIKATPDGEYLIASGTYPSQVKVYELGQLGLKFERHLDSAIVDFEILDDDYSKLAFLCVDRSINLHAKYGKHHSLRIPRMGRDLTYDNRSCDLICAASSPDLYRINLEQGRFLSPLSTQSPALNVVSSNLHGLIACGGEDGAVECFDMRMKLSAARINAVAHGGDVAAEVTAIEFDDSEGLQVAVGSSAGKVFIYDLRTSAPIQVKDHMYESPILSIKWQRTLNTQEPKLITTDKHIVRIWDPNTGEGMTSIQPTTHMSLSGGEINDIYVFPGSGLMLLALNSSLIPSYFIPELGPAPKWCSPLENLTEEMEETGQTTIYDNYKFVTKEELEKLQLTPLIGTDLLKAQMHGYFMKHHLYKDKKINLPKVNRDLAATIHNEEGAEEDKKSVEDEEAVKKVSKKKKPGLSGEDFSCGRFDNMFHNPDFQIDPESYEYRVLHPVASSSTKQPSLLDEHFEAVSDDDENSDSDVSRGSDDGRPSKKLKTPKLFVVKNERHAEAFHNGRSLAKEDSLPMGERVKGMENQRGNFGASKDVKFGPGGSREISFNAGRSSTYREDRDDEDGDGERNKRRGVQSLGLKQDVVRGGFRGRGGGGFRGRGGGVRGRGGSRGRGRR
ncbi:nucleolar protein 10-like isoform X2 [Brassica napus]|uniref:nucleolar protein 10-like isoform X2 n=1 Tax=Brassica napus TaxID=3708 RepID=UPI000BBE28E0|nr:nucleolar protein 10-like isoform X2 [Brassica napus]